jgi:hypothetical protein
MGGNVFTDTKPFDQRLVKRLTRTVNSVLKSAKTKAIPIGSGATPTPGKMSNDLDLILDQAALSEQYEETNPRQLRRLLRATFEEAGFETAQSGVSVHVKVPLENESYQVDIMVVPNAENTAKFHIHEIPEGSPYKGMNKHLALAYLARQQNMLWSPFQGLYKRDNGVKGELVTDDADKVAELLIGNKARAKDLSSLESIMAAMDAGLAQQMLTDLKTDPSWKENVVESAELKRIKQLSGL